MLRFQLISERVGVITIEEADPVDIHSITKKCKRSADGDGVTYEIIMEVRFIKASRDFIIEAYETDGGIDALVLANLFKYDENQRSWKLYSGGQLDFKRYDVTEDDVTVNIIQTGIEMKVLNMMETDVDLETLFSENGTELPEQITQEVLFHSKTLLKEYNARPQDTTEYQQLSVANFNIPDFLPPQTFDLGFVSYGQIDLDKVLADDLKDFFSTPFGFTTFDNPSATDQLDGAGTDEKYIEFLSAEERKAVRNPKFVVTESGTLNINLSLRLRHEVEARSTGSGDIDLKNPDSSGILGRVEIYAWIERRNSNDEIIWIEKIGQWDTAGYGGTLRDIPYEQKTYSNLGLPAIIGDKYYVYVTYRVWGDYESPTTPDGDGRIEHDFRIQADFEETFIDFFQETTSEPSNVSGILLYEAFERCVQFYSNQPICFKSDLLGRVDRGYPVDGKGSLILWTNGHRIRQRNEKVLFATLKQLIDFVNSLFCIGYGFEDIGGVMHFVVEERDYFYRKNERILSLGRVYNVRKKIDEKYYSNLTEYGYLNKIDLKQINSIDEFNTIRRSSTPILNTKNQLKIATDVLTGGYQIESQRRLITSTEDGKHDDNNFGVVVIRDGDGYKSKSNEGYDFINNVFSPETGYNYDISPAENLRNWYKWIGSCLIRAKSKVLRFAYGEVNYEMYKKKSSEGLVVFENGNFDLTGIEPVIDPELFIMEDVPLTDEQMQYICDHPFGFIDFEDKDGLLWEGFISTEGVDHKPGDETASFELRKVNRKIL